MDVSLPLLRLTLQCSHAKIKKWNLEGYLARPLPVGTQGKPLRISPSSAFEIACLHYATLGGFSPPSIRDLVAERVLEFERGKLPDIWVLNPSEQRSKTGRSGEVEKLVNSLPDRQPAALRIGQERRAGVLVIIRLREIADRIAAISKDEREISG